MLGICFVIKEDCYIKAKKSQNSIEFCDFLYNNNYKIV